MFGGSAIETKSAAKAILMLGGTLGIVYPVRCEQTTESSDEYTAAIVLNTGC